MIANKLKIEFYNEPKQSLSALEYERLLSNHFQAVARKAIKHVEDLEQKIKHLEKALPFGITFTWRDGVQKFVPAFGSYRGIRHKANRPISNDAKIQQERIVRWLNESFYALEVGPNGI